MDKLSIYENKKENLSDKERILSLEKANASFQIQLATIKELIKIKVDTLTGKVNELETLFYLFNITIKFS